MVVCAVATIRPNGSFYLVLWNPEHVDAAYRSIQDWLRDDELDFDWLDCAEMEAAIRDMTEPVG